MTHLKNAPNNPKETQPKCTVCSNGFTRREDLEQHIRTHSVEKPFSCVWCDRVFAGETTLNNHLKMCRVKSSFGEPSDPARPKENSLDKRPKENYPDERLKFDKTYEFHIKEELIIDE